MECILDAPCAYGARPHSKYNNDCHNDGNLWLRLRSELVAVNNKRLVISNAHLHLAL